jgi:Zn-dependent metalloprotease
MHRFRRAATCSILATLAVAGCSSDDRPEPTENDLAAQLEHDTAVAWTVYREPGTRAIRFLAPERPVAFGTGTPEEKARTFFARYRSALHASGKPEELELVSTATDRRGGMHVRFEHSLPGTGLPVFRTGTTAHFTADGSMYWLAPDFPADDTVVDAHATLTRDQASAAAIEHVKTACRTLGADAVAAGPELGALRDAHGGTALVYRVAVSTQGAGCIAPVAFVDARSGAVVELEETARRVLSPKVPGSRFYRALDAQGDKKQIDVVDSSVAGPDRFTMMSTDAQGGRIWTHAFGSNAPLTTDDIEQWEPRAPVRGAAVDAHSFAGSALTFLRTFSAKFERHKRFGIPPLSTDVHVYVHDNTRGAENAFAVADATLGDSVHFGDGDYPEVANALPMSAAYDVVAHELAHLVIQQTSRFAPAFEPGALDESFADVMGAAAEHALAPNDENNFLVGEGAFFKGPPGKVALRSMSAPQSLGDPDHLENKVPCRGEKDTDPKNVPTDKNDMCNIHQNAGIPNRAFSLMVTGGALYKLTSGKAPELRPVGVPTGIGWSLATEVVYWAGTGLQPTAGFAVAALAQVAESANVNIGIGQTVACAWLTVGIYEPRSPVEAMVLATVCKPPGQKAPLVAPPPRSNVTGSDLCSGHGDSFVCDPLVPSQAVVCKNGAMTQPAQTVFCADLTQACKKTSSTDPTAVTVDGVIACE